MKKLFYIMFFSVLLFMFKIEVNAAKMCVYKKDEANVYYRLEQQDDGTTNLIRIGDGGNQPFVEVKSDINFSLFNECPSKIYYSDSLETWSDNSQSSTYTYSHIKSITCEYPAWNGNGKFSYTYALTGEFFKHAQSYISWPFNFNETLTYGNFINDDGSYSCPKVCIKNSGGGRSYSSNLTIYDGSCKESDSSVYDGTEYNDTIWNSNDDTQDGEDISSKMVVCVSQDKNLSVTLNVDEQKIEDVNYSADFTSLAVYKDYLGNYSSNNRYPEYSDYYNTCDNECNVFKVVDVTGNVYGNVKAYAIAVEFLEYTCWKEPEKIETYKPVCGIFKSEDAGGKLLPIIKNLYKILKIAIPVLVIILTIVEFLKVLFSGEDKTMKDAFKATTTRFILIAVLIFLPIIIEFVIKITGMSENCLQYFL